MPPVLYFQLLKILYLWDQALYTEKLISAKSKELYFGKHIATGGGGYYGYGWGKYELPIENSTEKLQINEHSGGINGFNTLITRIPSDKNLIVFSKQSPVALI